MASSHEPFFDAKLIDKKLRNVKTLHDLTGKNGVFQELFRSTIEVICSDFIGQSLSVFLAKSVHTI